MRDFSYIIKRVIIGVSIALIIMAIKGTLFTRVSAKTTIQNGIAFQTPSDNPVKSYDDKYFTNIDYNSSLTYQDITALRYTITGCNSSSCNVDNSTGLHDLDYTFSLIGNSTYSNTYGISKIDLFLGGIYGYNHLELDKEYAIALKFRKDSNINWAGIYRNSATYFKFDVYDLDNHVTYEDVSFFKDLDFKFYIFYDDNERTNNAVLVVKFTPSSEDIPFNSNNISLQSFHYDSCGDLTGSYCDLKPYFLSGPKDKTFFNPVLYFIQGDILPYGDWCTEDGGHSGCGITGNNPFGEVNGMDVTHDQDLEVFNELPQCESLDVSCHVQSILQVIKDFFVRFGNYFRDFTEELKKAFIELFIPSNDYFEDFFDDLSDSLEQQLGFLSYPIVLLSNIFDRFYHLERSSHITYSGFEYPPGSNNLLIPAFDYDLDTLVSSGSMYTLYNIYFVFINGLFCFMFLRLCVKKFNQIFGGGAL